jgi:hypothetical protein
MLISLVLYFILKNRYNFAPSQKHKVMYKPIFTFEKYNLSSPIVTIITSSQPHYAV